MSTSFYGRRDVGRGHTVVTIQTTAEGARRLCESHAAGELSEVAGYPVLAIEREEDLGELTLNFSCANARAFLGLLGLEPGEGLQGEVSMAQARRAVIYTCATFARRAPDHTREASDTRRPGKARFIEGGIDEEYLRRRLEEFGRFLTTVAAKGATHIYWA